MPTYDYACSACGHRFELFQSITAPVKRKCPSCSKPKLQRLVGPGAGIIFKGGGFYETDYRSESYRKSAEAEKKSADSAAKPAGDGATKSADTSAATKDATSTSKSSDAAKSKPGKRKARS